MRISQAFTGGWAALFSAAFLIAACPPALAQMALQAAGGNYNLKVRTFRDIPFRTVVRQQYDYSCGSAALATLLQYHYGREVTEADVFKAMYLTGNQDSIRSVGFSLLDMKKYLESVGMTADGYRPSLADVAEAGVPAVTVVTIGKYRHFVIIKGMTADQVLLGDPALGLRKMPIPEFQKIWSGIVFAIHGGQGVPHPVFNNVAEWRPYAPAPLGQELDRSSLLNINVNLPVLYQVVQTTALRPNP